MSSFSLKLLAIGLMFIDHIGFLLFPKISILRYFGRLAFPIFAFQLCIGFNNTRSKEKYILRMLAFTFISQLPFWFFIKTAVPNHAPLLNIGATFTCALVALYCIDKIDKNWLKCLSVFLIILVPIFIPMDYGWYGVVLVILFYVFMRNKILIGISFFILVTIYCTIKESIFNLPALWALIPIFLYNGKKGANIKYFFYIFYPLHMLILIYLKNIYI